MGDHDPCQALQQLLATMHRLRAPGGCSWDAAQTPVSLLPYLMEETCEVIEAIEDGDPRTIVDELGDLLLQIVFQAEIFAERGAFDFADVAVAINRKLQRRHPHVFHAEADSGRQTTEQLAKQWEEIKQREQAAHPEGSQHPLGTLPRRLPALQRAQKLAARARRTELAIDWPAPPTPCAPQSEEELGAQLLELVRYADTCDMDAEGALHRAIHRVMQAAQRTP